MNKQLVQIIACVAMAALIGVMGWSMLKDAQPAAAQTTSADQQVQLQPEQQAEGANAAPQGQTPLSQGETAQNGSGEAEGEDGAAPEGGEPAGMTLSMPAPLPAANISANVITGTDTFGTPEQLTEDEPRYKISSLALQTGLDQEVLDKMYTPFYVLDIDYDEMYYPLTSPGGKHGEDKIFGGQCGVDVLSYEGDYAKIHAYRYPGGREITGYVPKSMLKLVTPKDRYSIIVDKKRQMLFLFEYGELKESMKCSSGKYTTETPAGEYIKHGTKDTIYSDADPDIAYYGIHLNGRVYIHSVSQVGGDYSKSISQLGHKASHGCVRVPLDWAKWFYNNIPDGTKVIITEYREDV